MNISVFLGAPGSGKGTQAKKLVTSHGFAHFSTGDMLRSAIAEKSSLGSKLKAIIDKGDLVPDATMIELIEGSLRSLKKDARVILDGFPRTVPQGEALDNKPETSVRKVVHFVVPEDILIRRLTGRRLCEKCGESFHLEFLPPKKEDTCDKCGGKLIQRKDDHESVVTHRLNVFSSQTAPLLEYYQTKGKLHELSADQPVEKVQRELLEILV